MGLVPFRRWMDFRVITTPLWTDVSEWVVVVSSPCPTMVAVAPGAFGVGGPRNGGGQAPRLRNAAEWRRRQERHSQKQDDQHPPRPFDEFVWCHEGHSRNLPRVYNLSDSEVKSVPRSPLVSGFSGEILCPDLPNLDRRAEKRFCFRTRWFFGTSGMPAPRRKKNAESAKKVDKGGPSML